MVYKFFDKTTSGGTFKDENISNKELAQELHKPIIKKIKKRKHTHLSWTIFGVLISVICN